MKPIRERLGEFLAGDLIRRRVGDAETRLKAEADTRVREALSVGLTRADQQLMEQGFRRLTQDSKYAARDLTPLAQDRMLALAYWLWESNPLAQWLVEVVVDFVWGEGGQVTAAAPQVREVVQVFWEDPVNQLELRMDTFVRELGLQGELCLPVFVNDMDGHVRLGYVDPAEIDEIQTDPNNILIPWTVVLKATGAGERKRFLKVVRLDERRGSPGFGSLMPALPNETDLISGRLYDGSCLLFQVNKVSNARRGRSDLLALIDWLDGYDALLFDYMERAGLLGSFIWDAEVQGATEEELQAFLQKNAKIRKGMIRAHNEKVKWQAIAPDIKSYETDEMARMLRGHMLGSKSIPEHYYSQAGGDAPLATAQAMELPTIKRMTRRQRVVRFMLQDLARFAVHQAIGHGRLPKDVDQTLAVTLPEISMRDTTAITTALTSLTVALVQAEQQGWLRRETAAKLFALVGGQLGLEIKAEEELSPAGEPTREAMRDYDPAKVRQLRDRLERDR